MWFCRCERKKKTRERGRLTTLFISCGWFWFHRTSLSRSSTCCHLSSPSNNNSSSDKSYVLTCMQAAERPAQARSLKWRNQLHWMGAEETSHACWQHPSQTAEGRTDSPWPWSPQQPLGSAAVWPRWCCRSERRCAAGWNHSEDWRKAMQHTHKHTHDITNRERHCSDRRSTSAYYTLVPDFAYSKSIKHGVEGGSRLEL